LALKVFQLMISPLVHLNGCQEVMVNVALLLLRFHLLPLLSKVCLLLQVVLT